jgi:hypothetical protein
VRVGWLKLLLLLAACQPLPAPTVGSDLESQATLNQAAAECRASGGEPVVNYDNGEIALNGGRLSCGKRTTDGGKACEVPQDCEATCLPKTKTCAAGYIAVAPIDDENLDFFASVKPKARN